MSTPQSAAQQKRETLYDRYDDLKSGKVKRMLGRGQSPLSWKSAAPRSKSGSSGELRVRSDSREDRLVVGNGFAEITQYHVTILTDIAHTDRQIDEKVPELAVQTPFLETGCTIFTEELKKFAS